MPLLGRSAMLLSFDVVPEAIDEHDRWHTHEHLPERLSIPGFRRGTRWVAIEGGPRYMVLYEVDDLAVLTSAAYLARLDHPTPWTARMMPHYRGMRRGLCAVAGSTGFGLGGKAALLRYRADEGSGPALDRWLLGEVLPGLVVLPGLGSAHLLHGAVAAPMTAEQRIRGADAGVDSAIVVTGYDATAVAACARRLAAAEGLPRHGAQQVEWAVYDRHYALAATELGGG